MRVLFLCSDNSARSPIAEALLRQRNDGRSEVLAPAPSRRESGPLTLKVLEQVGVDASGLASKPVDQVPQPGLRLRNHCLRPGGGALPRVSRRPRAHPRSFSGPAAVAGSDVGDWQRFRRLSARCGNASTSSPGRLRRPELTQPNIGETSGSPVAALERGRDKTPFVLTPSAEMRRRI
jgi:arsenate reductase